MNKANHQAKIVRINELLQHTNADTLELIHIEGYQVVSKKGQFKTGDLAIYVTPDSVVPQTEPFRFIWEPYMCTPASVGVEFTVPEKKRRITVRKFRGEWSEGLLLPVTDFWLNGVIDQYGKVRQYLPIEGEDVSELLGITHYDPDAGKETGGENSTAPKLRKKYPTSFKGWYKWTIRRIYGIFRKDPLGGKSENISLGIPTYDVDAFKNYPNVFVDGEQVIVTEKIHGSNARYIFLDGVMYVGSRTLWKSPNSNCIWRKALKENPWIEEWCRAHEGYVLWGEVTPTQGGYEYGSKKPQFFVFDIRQPDGTWAEYGQELDTTVLTGHFVPFLYHGPFIMEKIKALVDGPSTVKDATNIREGVVVKTLPERHVHGLGRAQLKIVSNKFLEKDNK